MHKEIAIKSIDEQIKLYLDHKLLTAKEINAILDDYRANYAEPEYSFLSDLKRN